MKSMADFHNLANPLHFTYAEPNGLRGLLKTLQWLVVPPDKY